MTLRDQINRFRQALDDARWALQSLENSLHNAEELTSSEAAEADLLLRKYRGVL
jgi:hypothetical protein